MASFFNIAKIKSLLSETIDGDKVAQSMIFHGENHGIVDSVIEACHMSEIKTSTELVRSIANGMGDYLRKYPAPPSYKQRLWDSCDCWIRRIADKLGVETGITFEDEMPRPVARDLGVDLIKALHDEAGKTKEKLAEELNVGSKTIQTELRALDPSLREGGADIRPLRIAGQEMHPKIEFRLQAREDNPRAVERVYYMKNRLHPIALQLNTQEAATLLLALFRMNEDTGSLLSREMALDIWCQLSNYGQCRIREKYGSNDREFNAFLDEIEATAAVLRKECDAVVVAGIGGSYLGAKAVIEALSNAFQWLVGSADAPTILFAGNNIGEDYLYELTDYLKGKKFGVINISKSGTTTETALTFRLLKKQCEEQMGKEMAKKVIVAVTDAKKGAARTCADKEGYKSFIIPDNVGGRFSVLTPVGLLPIACAGFDIKALVSGAQDMEKVCGIDTPFEENPAAQYAAIRNGLYQAGKKIEIMVNFQPKLHFMSEWWKQLYGESEGKDKKGIFPASCDFTTDLHSMGQWIQDGERTIFETVISVEEPNKKLLFPSDEENLDGLNFLAGKRVDEVNKMAELGTRLAHVDGGVPNIRISMPQLNEYYLGQVIYFFEIACGISGNILGVNPFNQPGVEAYKKNMFALLDKPGYEEDSKAIKARLAQEA